MAASTTRKCSSKWRCSIITVRRDSLKTSWANLRRYFASLDDSTLLARLQEYRPTGRQGYPLKALWRAYVGSFVLNLPHTNALIRRLEDDDGFRHLCGFGTLPHRTTFNRFILRLSRPPRPRGTVLRPAHGPDKGVAAGPRQGDGGGRDHSSEPLRAQP